MHLPEVILRHTHSASKEAGAASPAATLPVPVESTVAPAPRSEEQSDAVSAAHREMVRVLGQA